jgi:hypothetical protein
MVGTSVQIVDNVTSFDVAPINAATNALKTIPAASSGASSAVQGYKWYSGVI